MSLKEERLQILKMLEEGKINASDAAKLLSALDRGAQKEGKTGRTNPSNRPARWFRVRVTEGERTKVNVNLPIGLMNVALKVGAKFVPEMEDLDIDETNAEIQEAIQNNTQGKIIDIHQDNELVEIFIHSPIRYHTVFFATTILRVL